TATLSHSELGKNESSDPSSDLAERTNQYSINDVDARQMIDGNNESSGPSSDLAERKNQSSTKDVDARQMID
ncbi:hypothetical protein OS493_031207, partial [Desmophyllum pertusum]